MTATISITESALLTALRAFLLGIVAGEVIRAQGNRAAMPVGDFCTMTPLFVTGLSTNRVTYTDPGSNPGTGNNGRSSRWDCQLDFYGPSAADHAATVATLIRTDYACEQFAASGVDMQPLYAGEPKQTTLINAEQQFENRWTVEFSAQFNPVVSTPQDFAAALTVAPASVDARFPT
ncbi:MAG TPA: hypothetical protein VGU03_10865 [Frateuria sp.]|uniref:phage neck terminator protein n=1 Tax=Frateuria sp. TaxID=2211372 RepID=UPI002DF20925|nr:hypothetical protein [Frateuria sp.]